MTGWVQPAPGRGEIAPGLVLSDTWTRFGAYLLDALVLFPVGVVTRLAFGPYTHVAGQVIASPRDIAVSLIGLAAHAAYFIGFWSGGRRASPAQRLCKLEVANAFDGTSLTRAQATRRWVAMGSWISLTSLVTAASVAGGVAYLTWYVALLITTSRSPTKQGLHDRFANTIVVREAGGAPGWLLAILAAALWVVVLYIWIKFILSYAIVSVTAPG